MSLAPHAASASASVLSDMLCGRKLEHCVEGSSVHVSVSHCIESIAWLPWQNEGAGQLVGSHGAGGGAGGAGGGLGFSQMHAIELGTCPPFWHNT